VTEYRDDARNFFEAYGWALSEATMVSRRNGEDLSF
jgi:nuclear transport factor 2 (NTF2) superfamily protein